MEFFRQEFDRFQEMVYTQVVKLGIYIFLYVFHEIGGHWRDCLCSFSEKIFPTVPRSQGTRTRPDGYLYSPSRV